MLLIESEVGEGDMIFVVMIFFRSTLGFRNNMSNLLFPQLTTTALLVWFLILHADVLTLIVWISSESSFWLEDFLQRMVSRLVGDNVRKLFWWLLFLNKFCTRNLVYGNYLFTFDFSSTCRHYLSSFKYGVIFYLYLYWRYHLNK